MIQTSGTGVGGDANRGILRLYVLHKLSKQSLSGYDLMADLSSITAGAWRPGPGSIYAILKDLEKTGHIKVDEKGTRSKQIFAITKSGEKTLESARHVFDEYSTKRWHRVRGLMLDLVSPKALAEMLNEGLKMQPLAWDKVLSSDVSKGEKTFLLKENQLLTERHLSWINSKLEEIGE